MNNILLTVIIPVYNQEELVIKAIDSLPIRDDMEILIANDGSTDNTLNNIQQYVSTHSQKNIRIINNDVNKGLGFTKNVLYDNAKGIYISELDSDDYVYTDKYNEAINELDGTDIVCIDLQTNDGNVLKITEESKHGLCAGTARFIRREFLGDTRCPEIKAGEDWYLNEDLLKKNPTEKFTGIVAYHYNFPREGSLFDLLVKGKL